MPEPFPGPADADDPAVRPAGTDGSAVGPADGAVGSAGCGLPGLPGSDGVRGLTGVVDLGGLEGVMNAVRAVDEAAGDPVGEDSVLAAQAGTGGRWPAAEVAAAAAEDMTPGEALAYWAARFAPGQMSDYALPGAAMACRRLASWAQAAELALVAEVATRAAARDASVPAGPDGRPAAVPEEAAAEIALALRLSQHGALAWTDLAITLAGRLAGTGAALAAGTIDLAKARLIAEATSVLDDRCAQLAQDKVLPTAGAKTSAQLRAALRRAVISVDPAAAERRREDAERRAKVGLYGDEDGTATLSGQNLPGAHAAAAMARITALARAMKSSGAGGGIGLLRAQVYLGLLLGTLPLIPPPEGAPPGAPGDPGDEPPGRPGSDPREPDEPGVPGDPDDPGDPGRPRDPDEPPRPGDPGDHSDLSDPSDPSHPIDPYGADGLGDSDSPDDFASSGGRDDPDDSGGPGDRGSRAEPGDPAGPDGAGSQFRSRDPTWPDLPVPGQVPAGLAPSGTGALAGLPRGPASTGVLHLTVPWPDAGWHHRRTGAAQPPWRDYTAYSTPSRHRRVPRPRCRMEGDRYQRCRPGYWRRPCPPLACPAARQPAGDGPRQPGHARCARKPRSRPRTATATTPGRGLREKAS